MGQTPTKHFSPCLAVSHLKPDMINDNSALKIENDSYDQNVVENIVNGTFTNPVRNKILYVLKDHEFNSTQNPQYHHDIYFINTGCNAILHIINTTAKGTDRVLTINLDFITV